MEGAMAVRVTAAHTAEARAEAGQEAGEGGVAAAAAAALAPGGFLGLPAPFSEEDEDDVHRCGRCQAEFTALEDFVQHKLQKVCQRVPQEALPATNATALLGQEVEPAAAGSEEPITVAHIVVEAATLTADISHTPDIVGGGHIKEVIVASEAEPGDSGMAEAQGSPNCQGPGLSGEGEQAQVKLLVNKDGRYVCMLCHKTFKTGSILKAHMVTHSSRKDHECKLCGASFRTKGSLIRHHRRHTDERPYKCAKCGKSFRESGALTRHLKSLTPCTEKIRFSMSKDVVVGKEDTPTGPGASTVGTVTSSAMTGGPMETSPVIHLVTDAKGTVIHEVHVQMQELPLGMKALTPEPPGPEELPCSSEGSRENLLHQAMQNSGIVLERVPGEEGALEPAPPTVSSPQPLGDGPPELPLLEVEQVETVGACAASVPLLGGWTLGTKSPCYPGRHQPPCCACSLRWKVASLSAVTLSPDLFIAFLGPIMEPPRVRVPRSGLHGAAWAQPAMGTRGVLWSPSRWPVRPQLCPGPTRALSAVRPSQRRPPWRPTKEATQGRGHSHARSVARPSPRPTCSRSTRRCTCTSAVSAVGTAGSSTRPSPTSAATGVSIQMRGPTPVPSVASATRPRWAPDPPSVGSLLPKPDLSLVPCPQTSLLTPHLTACSVLTGALRGGWESQGQAGPDGGSPQNAQQVHFRTHLEEKPHVCPFCSRGFREKGSLVRHVRHHTGEKPFKCYKCGRGFAEHGTLNRHLRTKGGCLLEVEELLVSEESPAAAAAVLADDPHTVLVEFSSVVADTQEYIIEATADDAETSEATEIIEGTQTEVDSHIMKVVQQIVHQASAGHQIIVQNVTMDQEAGLGTEAAAADTITIATPESLTEQVAMTLASAISEGTVLTARSGTNGAEQATVTMVSSEDIEILEHAGELVIASPEGQLEVQTVIV
ncbi:transcription factor E4F1 isoform X9 [Lagenorhynchus albirostris]|uniref:transcription factor E4F1 isoform X9 n=1 Tax=Lagenorhynchus albirostris TaxID=27610 RepID=UPI0028ECA33B|nr:transcription factor E4F1 isoform X9 [Lagenorhynchus albirostris]